MADDLEGNPSRIHVAPTERAEIGQLGHEVGHAAQLLGVACCEGGGERGGEEVFFQGD
jgi:hypothetical protein